MELTNVCSVWHRERERERDGVELNLVGHDLFKLCCQWWALITAFFLSWFKIREKEIQHSKGKTWISQFKAFNKWRWIQTGIEQSELSQSCREHEQSMCSEYVTEISSSWGSQQLTASTPCLRSDSSQHSSLGSTQRPHIQFPQLAELHNDRNLSSILRLMLGRWHKSEAATRYTGNLR
jgi:hypothetical protein